MTDESRKAFGDQFCVLKSKSGRGRELASEMLAVGLVPDAQSVVFRRAGRGQGHPLSNAFWAIDLALYPAAAAAQSAESK